MAKTRSWEVTDAFRERAQPLIPALPKRDLGKDYKLKSGGGCKPMDSRKVFDGIVYVLRTGCQWKALSKERFGNASSIHSYYQ